MTSFLTLVAKSFVGAMALLVLVSGFFNLHPLDAVAMLAGLR